MSDEDMDDWGSDGGGGGGFFFSSDSEDWSSSESDDDSIDHLSTHSDSEASDEGGDAEHDGQRDGAGMAKRWRFLWRWFKALRRRVSTVEPLRYDTDDVRLGRGPDDWRIEVDMDDDEESDAEQIESLRKMREALILTSMLAEVDYEAWITELRRTSRFKLKPFMDVKSYKLERKYSVAIYGNYESGSYSWEFLQAAFGVENYSAQFMKDLGTLAKIAAKEGVNVYKMEPLSLTFRIRCSRYIKFSRAHQVKIVRNVHECVTKIAEIEAKHKLNQRSSRYKGVPVFRLVELDVNFRSFTVGSGLLNELRKLLESGIHITSLVLPERLSGEEDVDGDAFFSAWVSLARAITGQSARPTIVSRATLPPWFCMEPYLSAFCSALPTAKGLRFVRLEKGGPRFDDSAARASEQSWAWLGYGLFHPSSNSSVETLSLKAFTLREKELDTLEDALDTKWDSLWYVWRRKSKMLGAGEEAPVRRKVTVMKGTTLKLKQTHYRGRSITTNESMPAMVMSDDDETSSRPLDILVPGFGFCSVDQSNLQKKKARRTNASANLAAVKSSSPAPRLGLTTLLLDIDDIDSEHEDHEDTRGDRVARLVMLVGSTLKSLSIEAEVMNDTSLTRCLDECPLLQNLRLGHMELESMFPLVRFHAQGRRLSSLELRDFSVPIEHFDQFLRNVADDQDDVYRLERLGIGQGWSDTFRKTTSDALIHLLETSKRLTHLHLFTTETWHAGENAFQDFEFPRFRRGTLTFPFELPCRLAFLSVLRPEHASSDLNPRCQLTEDLVRNVFELAAFCGRRVVVTEQDSFLRINRYD